MMNALILAGIGLAVWNWWRGKPEAPADEIPLPAALSPPPPVAKPSPTEAFVSLLSLQTCLRANGVAEPQVRALIDPIAPLLVTTQEPVSP